MLLRKAYRAMWAHKRAYLACVFLIMIGTMMLTAMGTAVTGLLNSKLNFYESHRLAHVIAQVGAVPVSEVQRLSLLPGIAAAQPRTVIDARAEVPGSDELITLRLHSFAPVMEDGEARINDFLVTGFTPSHANDIVTNYMFHREHGFGEDSTVTLFVGGRAAVFEVTGSFLAPEHVYIARGGDDMLPDHIGFGLGYITDEAMNNLTGRPGIANQILFTFLPGYEFEDVEAALQDALRPYGLIALLPREAQLSYSFVDLQVTAMQAMSTSMPFVFVFMAVVVLYLMLKRIIEQERTQIGTLKAFGYSDTDMLLHYMCYGGITGLIGGLLGFLYGAALSGVYLQMFLEFYVMPDLSEPVNPMYLLASLAIAMGGGLLGAFMGALKALKLAPAEAMRPESPKPIKFDIVGKIHGLQYILTSRGQMALRNIVRSPVRSGFVVMGVAFSFMLLTVYGDMEGMVDTLLYSQFEYARNYDVRVTLTQPVGHGRAIESAHAVPHIFQAEGLMDVPVTLRNEHLRHGTMITGVESGAQMFRIFDSARRQFFAPPTAGLIITNGVADQLRARAGDTVYISAHFLAEEIAVPIYRIVEQNVGSGSFMELAALSALLGEPPAATAILLNTDNIPFVTDFFKESELAGTVESVEATLQKYIDMMEPYSAIYTVMYIMGVAVAFAIIFNTATISLSERQREFATLRVLGMHTDEVCEIMRFEYWVLAVVGVLIGIPGSGLMMTGLNAMLDTTMMSMPSTLSTQAYVAAVIGCGLAIMLTNFSAKRRIAKFDMVEVLKERE